MIVGRTLLLLVVIDGGRCANSPGLLLMVVVRRLVSALGGCSGDGSGSASTLDAHSLVGFRQPFMVVVILPQVSMEVVSDDFS